MKFFVILLLLIACSCNNKYKVSVQPLDAIITRACNYTSSIDDPYELVSEGDALTFLALYESFVDEDCKKDNLDIYKHEYSYSSNLEIEDYETGQWNRYVNPVYEVELSRSGISTEGILGVLHVIWTKQDKEGINRLWDYGSSNNWILGAGPTEYTRMWHLVPIISTLKDKLNDSSELLEYQSEDAWLDAWDKITEYRGNVIADYVLLKGRVYKEINSIEKKFMSILFNKAPDCPIYHAVYNRFHEGNHEESFRILTDDRYFTEKEPTAEFLPLFHWGEASAKILYIYNVGIIRGL